MKAAGGKHSTKRRHSIQAGRASNATINYKIISPVMVISHEGELVG